VHFLVDCVTKKTPIQPVQKFHTISHLVSISNSIEIRLLTFVILVFVFVVVVKGLTPIS